VRLVGRDGLMFTLDNRRLAAFQQGGVGMPFRMGSSQMRVWRAARRCPGRGRGLPRMEVLTLPIRTTSTCLTLPSPALT